MGVYDNVCAIVIWTLEPRDAGEWDCVLNVEGYKLDTRKKLNLRLEPLIRVPKISSSQRRTQSKYIHRYVKLGRQCNVSIDS